jgi:hypothetical protein
MKAVGVFGLGRQRRSPTSQSEITAGIAKIRVEHPFRQGAGLDRPRDRVKVGPSLRWNEHIEGDGATIFRQACIAGSRRHRYRIRSKAASPLWSHGTASPSSGQRKASVNPPATRALRDALFYRWRRLDGGCPPAIGAAGPLGALPAPRGHIRGQDSGGSGGSGIGRVTSALKALQAAPVLAASPSPHRHTSALGRAPQPVPAQ